jgi:hypothetical protein
VEINGRWKLRRATFFIRPLPHFIVIGAQKGGTSALNYYLGLHARVFPASRKEVHFYDRNYHRGTGWYRAHFPLRARVSAAVAGEATPAYLAHPLVPRRIAAVQPRVKLIAVLRDPKTRALSHYQMSLRRGREDLPFDEAVRREEERISRGWEKLQSGVVSDSTAYRYFSYKHRGRYAEQLRRYLEYFDRSQLLVLSSEALRNDTESTMRRIWDFLGIPAQLDGLDLRPRRVGTYRTEISPETERYLEGYFRPLNEDLYELLGEDFGW